MNIRNIALGLIAVGVIAILTDTKIKIRPSSIIPDVTINTK